jgi:hypothetical protein
MFWGSLLPYTQCDQVEINEPHSHSLSCDHTDRVLYLTNL